MHPYGGSPRCPRCEKAVYAAEQVMGPGRRLYHKACLTCADCNKRLDSLSLVEHDEEPYCKNCHRKNFGTRDLRQANLPHRPDLLLPPLSPTRTGNTVNHVHITSPVRATMTGGDGGRSPFQPVRVTSATLLRPTRALSPTRMTFGGGGGVFDSVAEGDEDGVQKEQDEEEEKEVAHALRFPPDTPTHTGRSINGLPRSGQISPTRSPTKIVPAPPFDDDEENEEERKEMADEIAKVTMTLGRRAGAPLTQTPTGTRYGVASPLRATPTGAARWGGANTPVCPRCQKSVYFAEQVKVVGKTWHKGCLRCAECGTSLDATRLTEKEGVPHCHRCYNKLHGPAGHGYALLGKAGG